MAIKQFTVLKDMKYGTRMLRAGEPVDMDGPNARLYTALGAIGPRDADGSGRVIPAKVAATPPVTPPPASPTASKATRKAAPRKRTTKKRATAKK
jgi:hypothetical protein